MVVNDAIYDRNLITNTDLDFYSSRYRINSFGHKTLCSEIVNTISQIDAKSSRSCNQDGKNMRSINASVF